MLLISGCSLSGRVLNKQVKGEKKNLISYQTSGRGEALVFIHAGGLDQEMWRQQLAFFSRKTKVITYDLRGHGRTIATNESLLEIEDLLDVLEQEKVRKVNLVGCSLGAIVALDFALAYPERVDQLVLVSPGLVGYQELNEEYLEQLTQYLVAFQSGDQAGMLQELKRLNALGRKDRTLAGPIDRYVNEHLTTFIESGNHLRVPQIKELEPIKQLNRLRKVETLLLYGELDFNYVRENAKVLHEKLPQSELVAAKNAAHLINLEVPGFFNEKLADFLGLY